MVMHSLWCDCLVVRLFNNLPFSSVSSKVSKALLMALIPMGRKLLSGPQAGMSGFPELMMVMHTLAGAGNGAGHLDLFQAATSWLQTWSVFFVILCVSCLNIFWFDQVISFYIRVYMFILNSLQQEIPWEERGTGRNCWYWKFKQSKLVINWNSLFVQK